MAMYVPENLHQNNLAKLHIFNVNKPEEPASLLDATPQSGYFLSMFAVKKYAGG
jgi:hypothetical protein